MFPKQNILNWIVELEDGRSSVVAGTHPAQVYNYVKTFWPEKKISAIRKQTNG